MLVGGHLVPHDGPNPHTGGGRWSPTSNRPRSGISPWCTKHMLNYRAHLQCAGNWEPAQLFQLGCDLVDFVRRHQQVGDGGLGLLDAPLVQLVGRLYQFPLLDRQVSGALD